ncbi:MAG: D-aminoacylase [Bacillota bacterium]
MLDLKITGGTIIDGSGRPAYSADLGISGETIAGIGTSLPDAERVLSAAGRVVCPGFIDTHSHSDLRLLADPPPTAKLSQGITTELLGQDGLGVAPVEAHTRDHLSRLTAGLLGRRPPGQWTWRTFSDYLDALDEARLPNNQAVLASHGPLRLLAVGAGDRPATTAELDAMRTQLREALQQGAWGLSTGLIYPPCSYGPTSELAALTEVVAECDGVFVVHMRDEGLYLLDALDEVIDVCRSSGCRLHISHLQAHGRAVWHLLPRALERIDAAIDEGLSVTADRYPYLAGCTVLSAVLPAWMLDGGPQTCLKRLSDETWRARVHHAFTQGLEVWHNRSISVGWDSIVISWVAGQANEHLVGQSIGDISRETGEDPVDVVCDLLLEEQLEVTMIAHYGSEENLEKVLAHPVTVVGTDGIYGGRPHPRLWGTYPRFLGRYARDRGLMTLEEGIRKATSSAARLIGLRDRGTIEVGMKADLAVFDRERIIDRATYDDPEQVSEGMETVLVNGRTAWEGAAPRQHPGRVLRR